jgi:2-phospho-L-lactate/phosphoenolpyruvate guanylyltransferase
LNTVAVVPVKALHEAKTRLAGILSPEERAVLVLDMLSHVLHSLLRSGAVVRVAVISPDPDSLHVPADVVPILQTRSGLNNLLEQGREWALSQRADALLVVFADLPLLAPGDISRMVALAEPEGTLVLSPDRHGAGTNAMLSHPVSLAHFAFGTASLTAHLAAGHRNAAHVEVYRSAGTELDIDTLDDLEYLEAHRVATAMEYAFS